MKTRTTAPPKWKNGEKKKELPYQQTDGSTNRVI